MKPVIVAGGGIAGAAAACLLAKAGHPVQLIERERIAKDKICGEFISCEAQAYLSALGIDLTGLGAVPIRRLRIAHRDRNVESALPFLGLSLSRRILDEALLHRARELGVDVRRGHVIREIVRSGAASQLTVDGMGAVEADTLFLASGKHEVRGTARDVSEQPNDLIGLKSYFRLAPGQQLGLLQHVEIILFRGGYAGLQLAEEGRANLCLLVRRDRFAASGQDWPRLLAGLMNENAHLRQRLTGATDLLVRPLAISRIPYGFVHKPAPTDPLNMFRLGDQMAVTPSFSGDGMSIALHTAFAAAESHLAGNDASLYHQRMRREIGPQIRRAGLLSSALLNGLGQTAAMHMARLMPALLPVAASATRLPVTNAVTA